MTDLTYLHKTAQMKEYIKTDQQIHQLSQTLAKFGRSFSQQQKDDSHTNLGFDYVGSQVWSRWATIQSHNMALALNLEIQEFLVKDSNYQTIVSFDLIGKTQSDTEQTIAAYLNQHFAIEANDFLKPLHFEIPVYPIKNDTIKKWNVESVSQWLDYRNQANQACSYLANHLNKEAEIRIWPHHFDTGIYIEPNNKVGIGFGLAMADSMINEPYYYFSAYGLNGNTVNYSKTPMLSVGEWITGEHWNGAVLKLSNAKTTLLNEFLKDTTDWAVAI